MEWYEQPYFQHRDWILSHLEELNLNEKESLLVLILDFLNEHDQFISLAQLGKKLNETESEVEQQLSSLMEKGYLEIGSSKAGPVFDLKGLFLFDQQKEEIKSDLFSIFDQNFNRPLSTTELQKLSDWQKTYDPKVVLWALREALINEKVSFPYIETCILSAYNDAVKLREIIEGKR
ncbi:MULTISPECIES: DnaD domain protein [Terrabacteria group]|uniref:DnaD domain protein n=1 Tax=Bacillati TaxID=1783272 RepID=UPI0019395BE3|nr:MULTISPECIES: DnaD domain protein [Terrabacteria group]MBW9212088.1 DnaD domain protein [Trueperella sp. zg.1013]QRG87106.1 DnaD domain protein [Bulleidia sp. zg-1006]